VKADLYDEPDQDDEMDVVDGGGWSRMRVKKTDFRFNQIFMRSRLNAKSRCKSEQRIILKKRPILRALPNRWFACRHFCTMTT
jgi:hypothetical protein